MLIEGLHFTCDSNRCSSSSLGAHFAALQRAINHFTVNPIPVDGVLTDVTLKTLREIGPSVGIAPLPVSVANLAQLAMLYRAQLDAFTPGAEPAPENVAAVQQLVTACRTDRTSEQCSKAKVLCDVAQRRGASEIPEVRQICAAASPRATWPFWLFGTVAVAGVGVGAYAFARRRRRQRWRQLRD